MCQGASHVQANSGRWGACRGAWQKLEEFAQGDYQKMSMSVDVYCFLVNVSWVSISVDGSCNIPRAEKRLITRRYSNAGVLYFLLLLMCIKTTKDWADGCLSKWGYSKISLLVLNLAHHWMSVYPGWLSNFSIAQLVLSNCTPFVNSTRYLTRYAL